MFDIISLLKPLATSLSGYSKERFFKFQAFQRSSQTFSNVEMFYKSESSDSWKGISPSEGILLFKESPLERITNIKILKASSLHPDQLKTYSSGILFFFLSFILKGLYQMSYHKMFILGILVLLKILYSG